MLTGEIEANVEAKVSQLEVRMKEEEVFFTSEGTLAWINISHYDFILIVV
jgi:hypothetical protein